MDLKTLLFHIPEACAQIDLILSLCKEFLDQKKMTAKERLQRIQTIRGHFEKLYDTVKTIPSKTKI